MIICHDLMVKLGLLENFKHQVLQWDGSTVHMMEPIGLLGKSNLNKHDICKLVIQTKEPASTRETTEQTVKILNSNYGKTKLK